LKFLVKKGYNILYLDRNCNFTPWIKTKSTLGSPKKHGIMEEKIMFRIAKKSLAILMIAVLLIAPSASIALAEEYFEKEDPSGGEMIYDFILVRPIGIVATAVGSVFYVISLPFSALGGNSDEAVQALVKEPAAYTFKRPLGDFSKRSQ
jgi:hypothetical protein